MKKQTTENLSISPKTGTAEQPDPNFMLWATLSYVEWPKQVHVISSTL